MSFESVNRKSRLEAELAAWLAPCIPNAQALYFCTGFMANLALLAALPLAHGAPVNPAQPELLGRRAGG